MRRAKGQWEEWMMVQVDKGNGGQQIQWTMEQGDKKRLQDQQQFGSETNILRYNHSFLISYSPRSSPSKQAESGPSPGVTLMKTDR
ncbi:hypothetical protein SRHO_G00310240 [Serrasalmus rhombeus]